MNASKLVVFTFGFISAASLTYMGCASQLTPQSKNSSVPGIEHSEKQVGDAAKALDTTTKDIKVEANAGMKETPAAVKTMLDPHWTKILTDAGVQENLVSQLTQTQKDLQETGKRASAVEGERDQALTRAQKAEESVTKELRQKYVGLSVILFAISLLAGGVGIWMQGNKVVLWIAGLAGVGSLVCIFLVQTIALIPWIIGGLLAIVVVLVLYSLYRKHGDLTIFKNATTQLVQTVENAKPFMTVLGRRTIFGNGAVNGIAHSIQNDDTQTVVDQLRKDIEKAPALPGTIAADAQPILTPSPFQFPVQSLPPSLAPPMFSEPTQDMPPQSPNEASFQNSVVADPMAVMPISGPQQPRRRCGSRKITSVPSASKQRVLFI